MPDEAVPEQAMTVEHELKPGQTWLVRDIDGRLLVHKRLPDDCLKAGQLHPSIKLRLARLRELPLGCFANLIGVERDAERGVVLVSEYVHGQPLAELTPAERQRTGRELQLAVTSMHQLGLVHGAIHEHNVIVDGSGKLWLIDPSPLLHDDPAVDLRAIDRVQSPTRATPPATPAKAARDVDGVSRQRTLMAAVAIVVLAVGVAIGIRHFFVE